MSFFNSNQGTKLFLDIRSGSIGATLAVDRGAGGREIVVSLRKRLPIQIEFQAERLLAKLPQILGDILRDAAKRSGGKHPSTIHITLAAPWQVAQARTVTHKGERAIEYSRNLETDLIGAEQALFLREFFPEGAAKIIECKTFSTELNGYRTSDPSGKKAAEFKFSFYLSGAPTELVELLESCVRSVYHGGEIVWHTFSLLSLVACNYYMQGQTSSYLLVDIGGEISEASVVSRQLTSEVLSFPLGAHSLLRTIATGFKTSIEEAESLYRAFLEGRVSEAIGKRIESTLADIEVKWVAYMHGILEKIAGGSVLPRDVLVLGNKDTASLLLRVLGDATVKDLFKGNSDSRIALLLPEMFLEAYRTRLGTESPDIFLATEIFAIDKLSRLA